MSATAGHCSGREVIHSASLVTENFGCLIVEEAEDLLVGDYSLLGGGWRGRKDSLCETLNWESGSVEWDYEENWEW